MCCGPCVGWKRISRDVRMRESKVLLEGEMLLEQGAGQGRATTPFKQASIQSL